MYDPDPGGWEVHRPPFFGFNFGFEPLALNNFATDTQGRLLITLVSTIAAVQSGYYNTLTANLQASVNSKPSPELIKRLEKELRAKGEEEDEDDTGGWI